MRSRRRLEILSMSFLDVMSCGFGAVILIYLLLDHSTDNNPRRPNDRLSSEMRKLDYQVETGEKNLADTEQSLADTQRRLDEARNRRIALTATLTERSTQLAALTEDTSAKIEHLNKLKADVESLQKDAQKQKAANAEEEGKNVHTFAGEGDRQYLTGLKVGGSHVLIALDTSASMLDDTVVNVLRRRNMDDKRKLASPKWQRAQRTVEWIAAQLPLDSQFQIVPTDEPKWLDASASKDLEGAIAMVRKTVPDGGTNLRALALEIARLSPAPDNIFLITDGLPTQGAKESHEALVKSRQREEYFDDAVSKLPNGVPVNVILFPMEGDLFAAGKFWALARRTAGSFLAPSRDWP
jgi:hypothetical protein